MEEHQVLAGVGKADLITPVNTANDELKGLPNAVRRHGALELKGVAFFQVGFLCDVLADDAASLVVKKGLPLLRIQMVLRIHGQECLGLDREVREEIARLGEIAHAAEPDGNRDPLDTRDSSDLGPIGFGHPEGQADVVAGDEARRTGTFHLSTDGVNKSLQGTEEKDADRHRQYRAGRANPVTAQVTDDKRKE